MRNSLRTYTGKGIFMAAMACTVLIFASCNKKDPEKFAAPYVGTWKGGSACGGVASTAKGVVINAGSDGVSVTTDISLGDSSCMVTKQFKGTADESNLTFPTQYFTDNCGVVWTVSGFASIYRDTLTFTFTGTGKVKGLDISGTCTFKGYK